MIYLYTIIVIGLELVVWLVPDIIGNAVAVSFVGLLLGPMYPIVMKVMSELVPKRYANCITPWDWLLNQTDRILTPCIGWIAS